MSAMNNYAIVKPQSLRQIFMLGCLSCLLFFTSCNFFYWEASCDWSLAAQAWEDTNGNGVQDANEPPLENVAILDTQSYDGFNAQEYTWIDGTDKSGQVTLLTRGIGNCPRHVQIKAIPPIGYISTTPDQVSISSSSISTVKFGFQHQPNSPPNAPMISQAECDEDYFKYSGAVTGVVKMPNGDTWVTSQSNGGVTLRKDGKDISQDIDYFGSYAADIATAPDGTIWVAGGLHSGIARFNGTSWKTYTTVYGALPSNDVSHVAISSDGHVWALTSAGLTDFNPISGRWRDQSYLGSGFLLLNSPDGKIWLVDQKQLTNFQSQSPSNTVQHIPVKLDSVVSVDIWNAAVARNGSIWIVGTADEWPMAAHYEPLTAQWTNYTYLTTRGLMPLDKLNSVGVLSDGSAIIGAYKRGVIRLIPASNPTNAKWVVYPKLEEYSHNGGSGRFFWGAISVLSIFSDTDIWFSYGSYGLVLMCKLAQHSSN